jgi:toluene monooxygenase system protein E
MTTQKTYWHLLEKKRMPSEYEIVTSKLLTYTGEGFTGKRFELDVPLKEWYHRYQEASPLKCSSWEKFYDPRETTYTKYTGLQMRKETFVDGILQEIESTGYDEHLSGSWLYSLSRLLSPLRYPVHGFQMIAAYVAQMAPSGRIAIAGILQVGDEIRRVERLAYRVRQLQLAYPGFADDSQARWERDPMWQPLRQAIEKLLVTYDWAESFVALNLVLKPLVDQLFMKHLSHLGLLEGDYLLGQILYSLDEDCRWHRQWSHALVKMVLEDSPSNHKIIQEWIDKWYDHAKAAVSAFAVGFEGKQDGEKSCSFSQVSQSLTNFHTDFLTDMTLKLPS